MEARQFVSRINWLGHDVFRIAAQKTVYIDPYEIKGGTSADLILITHPHFDHCSVVDIAKVQGPQTIIVTEKESAAQLSGDVRILSPGERLVLEDIAIDALPAYNLDKDFHPRAKDWLGFNIELEGVRIYHAGDTDFIPEMKKVQTDIALLPVSGTYVMTAAEAVQAAQAIKPKIAIPMHFGAIVGSGSDADRFAADLAGKVDVTILEKS
jgi:L-ascorbate metabolism protein UlaG (beta-lactamase superfamily)